MTAPVSILSRQEREWVDAWIAGVLDIEENPELVRRVLERMVTELDAWHRLAWLWSDMKIGAPR